MKKTSHIQPHWWTKSLAGTILGLSLAMAMGNLLVILARPYIAMDLLVQLGMWSIAWFWMPILFLSYFFKSGKQAVVFLTLANLGAYFLLFWLRG